MVLITRPVVPSEPVIADISSAITNNDFSSPTISDNSFSQGSLTGWTFRLNSDTPTDPARARGTSAYGAPGCQGNSFSIDSYNFRPEQSQYWLSQVQSDGHFHSLYQTIEIPVGYSEIRIFANASGRNENELFRFDHKVEVYLDNVMRVNTFVQPGQNFRHISDWFSPPSGSVEFKVITRRSYSSDSTVFIHGVGILGR